MDRDRHLHTSGALGFRVHPPSRAGLLLRGAPALFTPQPSMISCQRRSAYFQLLSLKSLRPCLPPSQTDHTTRRSADFGGILYTVNGYVAADPRSRQPLRRVWSRHDHAFADRDQSRGLSGPDHAQVRADQYQQALILRRKEPFFSVSLTLPVVSHYKTFMASDPPQPFFELLSLHYAE